VSGGHGWRSRRPGGYQEPAPLGDTVPAILRGLRQSAGRARGPLQQVRDAWPEIVGEGIAVRTRIVAVDQGRIRVEVASAALKHDLATFRRPEILERLKERFPELRLRGLSFRVGAV